MIPCICQSTLLVFILEEVKRSIPSEVLCFVKRVGYDDRREMGHGFCFQGVSNLVGKTCAGRIMSDLPSQRDKGKRWFFRVEGKFLR